MNHVASPPFLPPWLKTTLVGIGAVLLLLFMCLFVAITVVQKYPAKLIPFVENLTGQLLDRELEIGELNQIELNREIYLVAHDVVLSNPEWADTPDFARVGTLRIRIDLLSILSEGPIIINELELNDATLTLLAPEKHPPNWDFWPNEEKQQPQHSSSVFPVLIPDGKISNSTIVYRDSDQGVLVSIDQLELQEMPDASLVNLNVSGKINEIPLSVQGHIGPAIALLTQQDLRMELAVQWGQLTVKSSGTIGDLPSLSGVNMQLEMTTPNARALLGLLGMPEVHDGPLYLVGDINDADTGTAFKVDGTLDKFDLHLSGTVENPQLLDGVDVVFKLSGPSLIEVGAIFSLKGLPETPFNVSGEFTRKGPVLEIIHGDISVGQGDIKLDGRLPNFPEINGLELTLSGSNLDLSMFGKSADIEHLPSDLYDIKGQLNVQNKGIELTELQIDSAQSHLTAQFVADNIHELSSLRGNIKLTGTSSHQLIKLLGSDAVFPDADYNLNVVVESKSGSLHLKPISLQWGKNNLSGTVDIKPGDIPVVHADLHSQFVDLTFLLPDVEVLQKEKTVRDAAGTTSHKADLLEELTTPELSDRVIPDESLDFSWLQKIEGSLKYKADEMFLHDEGSSGVVVDLSIKKGVLSTRKFAVDGAALIGDAKFTVKPLGEGADIDLHLDLKRAPLLLLLGGEPEYQADSIYRAKIKTHGNSLRELAANSNGALVFKGGGGRLEMNGLGLILGDIFQEILGKINPLSTNEPYTQLACHAGAMFIKNGELLVSPGAVVRTEKVDFAFDGKIDLHNEKVNMNFSTHSRTGLGVSASKAVIPYFKIGGTLAHPRLALNKKGALVSGGTAVATAGLSILAEGMWDRWVATSKNPCESLIARYRAQDESGYQLLLPASQ